MFHCLGVREVAQSAIEARHYPGWNHGHLALYILRLVFMIVERLTIEILSKLKTTVCRKLKYCVLERVMLHSG